MLESIISGVNATTGIVGLLLLAAVIYQTTRIAEERKERIEAQKQLFDIALEQTKTNNAMVNSLDNLGDLIKAKGAGGS